MSDEGNVLIGTGDSGGIKILYTGVSLATEWGLELFWRCSICSAVVEDDSVHTAWHDSLRCLRKGEGLWGILLGWLRCWVY